jgi:hypothetical protein
VLTGVCPAKPKILREQAGFAYRLFAGMLGLKRYWHWPRLAICASHARQNGDCVIGKRL